MWIRGVTHKLVVSEQVNVEAEGEKQFVLLEERAAHVDVQWVGEVVSQNLQSVQEMVKQQGKGKKKLYLK